MLDEFKDTLNELSILAFGIIHIREEPDLAEGKEFCVVEMVVEISSPAFPNFDYLKFCFTSCGCGAWKIDKPEHHHLCRSKWLTYLRGEIPIYGFTVEDAKAMEFNKHWFEEMKEL